MGVKEWVYTDHNSRLVVFKTHAVIRLLHHRQVKLQAREAGGVLIGERRGKHLAVCCVSEPGRGDKRKRYLFIRKGKHHQSLVDSRFRESQGTQQYLGEWHTHPEDHPSPSSMDIKSWKTKVDDSRPMIILIIGRKSNWAALLESGAINPLIVI